MRMLFTRGPKKSKIIIKISIVIYIMLLKRILTLVTAEGQAFNTIQKKVNCSTLINKFTRGINDAFEL